MKLPKAPRDLIERLGFFVDFSMARSTHRHYVRPVAHVVASVMVVIVGGVSAFEAGKTFDGGYFSGSHHVIDKVSCPVSIGVPLPKDFLVFNSELHLSLPLGFCHVESSFFPGCGDFIRVPFRPGDCVAGTCLQVGPVVFSARFFSGFRVFLDRRTADRRMASLTSVGETGFMPRRFDEIEEGFFLPTSAAFLNHL